MQNQESELIARSLSGDHEAYAELVDRYKQALFRHSFAIVRDKDVAKDIAQETFVKAYFRLQQYNNNFKFSTWLFKIATNLALDSIKKQKRQMPLDTLGYEPIYTGASPYAKALHAELHAAVAKLPPNHRSVISLYYWEGKSYEEVAFAMEVPIGTVRSWLSRAKTQLKEKLS